MNKKSFLYCFVLGTNHSLSKVEIINLLLAEKIEFEVIEASKETLIIKTSGAIDGKRITNISGNIAKLIEIIKTAPFDSFFEQAVEKTVKENFIDLFLTDDIIFGISVYGSGGGMRKLDDVYYLASPLSKEIKESLTDIGKKVRFLSPKERVLSTVSVNKKILAKQGLEISLCVGQNEIYIGKTIAVQDYESYSFRDYGRPKRNLKSGMIPPKLAKTMINLANKDKAQLFLDPFCGMGTILEELILLGYKKIIGTDIQKEALEDSKANLDWLFENYQSLKRPDYQVKLKKTDVRELAKAMSLQKVDAIITEPFLGSAESRHFNFRKINSQMKKLESLYLDAFKEFKKILNKNGVVVIIFPVFRFRSELFHLNILEQIKQIGLKQEEFLPFISNEVIESLHLEITERESIIYYRPGQAVSREIFIFKN